MVPWTAELVRYCETLDLRINHFAYNSSQSKTQISFQKCMPSTRFLSLTFCPFFFMFCFDFGAEIQT